MEAAMRRKVRDDREEWIHANVDGQHCALFEQAKRKAFAYAELERLGECRRSGRVRQEIPVRGVKCSVAVNIGLDYRGDGYISVSVSYKGVWGEDNLGNLEDWPMDSDYWTALGECVAQLLERSPEFREVCQIYPEYDEAVSDA